jgi:protein-L-isoaspartate(D-aspartate) O-methyltransferase
MRVAPSINPTGVRPASLRRGPHSRPIRGAGIALLIPLFVAVVMIARNRPTSPPPRGSSGAAPTAQSAGEERPTSVPTTRSGALDEPPAATSQPTSPHVSRDSEGRLTWPRPRVTERQAERDRMVDTQIARGDAFRSAVSDPRVLAAMRAVPRHALVPEGRRRAAYDDTPLPIGHAQTISQPYIVALMTELLGVEPGDTVLEIGTGSGYQAAVLSELTPWVFSIEIIEPLHKSAAQRLEQLGYVTIRTKAADGYFGWEEVGPFDGIIVTCAAGHVPPPLWGQLKPGGRMVIPLGGPHDVQRLVVLTKRSDGSRQSRSVIPVAFVPMTGRAEKP